MKHLLLSALAFVLGVIPALAQAQTPGFALGAPLKVEVVLIKKQGDAVVKRLPYTIAVKADDQDRVRLNMGVSVPVRSVPSNDAQVSSVTYRSVGTTIECRARTSGPSEFTLDLVVSYSSIDQAREAEGGGPVEDSPRFSTFEARFSPILRDGQSAQLVAGTDPVSGDVFTIDVSVRVVK